MIRRETDYAIRTVLCLARQSDAGPVSTQALANEAGVPFRFLRKIVSKLVAVGIVRSRRGKGGGLQLSGSAQGLSLLALLQCMEPESVLLNQCTDGASPATCERTSYCELHRALRAVQHKLHAELAAITIREMIQS